MIGHASSMSSWILLCVSVKSCLCLPGTVIQSEFMMFSLMRQASSHSHWPRAAGLVEMEDWHLLYTEQGLTVCLCLLLQQIILEMNEDASLNTDSQILNTVTSCAN